MKQTKRESKMAYKSIRQKIDKASAHRAGIRFSKEEIIAFVTPHLLQAPGVWNKLIKAFLNSTGTYLNKEDVLELEAPWVK